VDTGATAGVCACAARIAVGLALLLWSVVGAPAWAQAQAWHVALTVSSGEASRELVLGQHPEATPAVDGRLGELVEVELPPLPPLGSLDARFVGPQLGNGVAVDLRPLDAGRTDTLTIAIQAVSDVPTVVRWDAAAMAARTALARLTDLYWGLLGVEVDMRATGELTVADARIDRLRLVVRSATPTSVDSGGVQDGTWGEVKTAR